MALADVHVPQEPPVGLLVVHGDAAADDPFADYRQHIAEELGLQQAVFAGHDPVRVRRVEPEAGVAVFVEGHRELGLVAVAQGLFGPEHREHVHAEVGDALEGVHDALPLVAQLGLIGDVPVAASAAAACHRTVRRHAVGRRLIHLVRLADGIVLLRLDDMAENGVADRGVRHEDGHAVVPPDAAPFGGHGVYGQRDLVVLFEHVHSPFSGGLPAVRRPYFNTNFFLLK